MWGIIPAAGRGTRIQPLAFSKELLPVGSRLVHGSERPRAVDAAAGPAGAVGAGDALGATAGIKSSDTAAAIAVVAAGRFPNRDKRDTRLLLYPRRGWERRQQPQTTATLPILLTRPR